MYRNIRTFTVFYAAAVRNFMWSPKRVAEIHALHAGSFQNNESKRNVTSNLMSGSPRADQQLDIRAAVLPLNTVY